ncbi:Rieske 2Fe-2S domain-containing protein [Paraburkholderia sediminicola]|uniref:Rieske 2Fe-2S domain-containing protein n=1 Tax=Paraburkholderia sediminicola TaxID=458836 RepID=UPI0038B98FEB
MSSYLKNAWYIAAWSPDVGRDLLRRVIMDEAILFYRKEDGTPVAMSNRCAHRFAPLHLGKLVGDTVACPYHGLHYESSGACVFNPNGNQHIPPARLRTYPLAERDGVVWIWPGDPEQADPSLLPDLGYLENPTRYAPVTGYQQVRANYRYIIDNLLDNAHLSTVHKNTLGCESFLRGTARLMPLQGDMIWIDIDCPPGPPGPIWTQIWQAERGSAPPDMDHWVEIGWKAGATIMQETGITPAGQPREKGIATLNCHLLTPETEQTTHYFWGIARPFQLNNPVLDEQMKIGATYAFSKEDEPMLAAIQLESGDRDFWGMKPALIGEDLGLTRVRRRMDELLKVEHSAGAT